MVAKYERIPLEWLIKQEKILKPIWEKFSTPQKTFIKAAYGMELETAAERQSWAIFNGACVYDELGYVTAHDDVPYEPREYEEIIGVIGRRAGKSYLTCFMVLYEALFGGHLESVPSGYDPVIPYICYDLPTSKQNMKYVVSFANSVPLLKKELATGGYDKIQFKNGIIIQPEPPTIKTGRGWAIPVVVMDEVGFWYKTSDNVNPDYEVQRALSYAQTQFAHRKQFIISTPYTEEGLLWDYALAGTQGKLIPESHERLQYENAVVMRCSTAAMENPEIVKHGRKTLETLRAKDDPTVFTRESLAQFIASESNFLPGSVIDGCVDKGVLARRREEVEKNGLQPSYVAVMDPAFRTDDFAFSIFHQDGKGRIVQDMLHTWTPNKKAGIALDPHIVLSQIAQWVREWNVPVVYSDQYQLEALQQLAGSLGFAIIGHDFTGISKVKIYGSLEQLLRTGRIRLLDQPVIRQQLSQLNKKLTALRNVQIGAPPGKKDDVATVCALGAHMSLQYLPAWIEAKPEKSHFQTVVDSIEHKRTKGDRWDF